ncbi:MAG: VCBS repeat-containing protein, partial [Planctomycetaceae bacterium]|nr:VCBS repeat-containing protein [Planctomycetaceae bacterium]
MLMAGCGTDNTAESPVSSQEIRSRQNAAMNALRAGNREETTQLVNWLVDHPPNVPEDLMQIAQIARSIERPELAISFYERMRNSSDNHNLIGLCMIADTLMYDQGQSHKAEEHFLKALEIAPQHGMALEGYAHLLQVQGRAWESVPYLIKALRAGQLSVRNLIVLGWINVPAENRPTLDLCLKHDPNDGYALLGLARIEHYHNQTEAAWKAIQKCVALLPENEEAQALYGELLLERNQFQPFLKWFETLSDQSRQHPDIQYVVGKWFELCGEHLSAAAWYHACIRSNPDHQDALFHLGNILVRINQPEIAQQILDRVALLEKLSLMIGNLHDNNPQEHPEWIKEAAAFTAQLGRIDEAAGWTEALLILDPLEFQAEQNLFTFNQQRASLPALRTSLPPEFLSNRSDFLPDPPPAPKASDLKQNSNLASEFTTPPAKISSRIHFEDLAEQTGMQFQFYSDPHHNAGGFYMYESMGGGGASSDYDLDGFPDLYWTQGCVWPPGTESGYNDQLFRNQDGQRFENRTVEAGIEELAFSQGVAAGDLNGDGFEDFYVANIGSNRIFYNNGDGTFSPADPPESAPSWTASAAIADLNGDGHADLYDVNYLSGEDLMTRLCKGAGTNHNCRPSYFLPAQDQIFLNNQSGGFVNLTETSGIKLPQGNGLGIIVAELDGVPGNDLFIANDFVPNYLMLNEGWKTTGLKFSEQAIPRGIAFDQDG